MKTAICSNNDLVLRVMKIVLGVFRKPTKQNKMVINSIVKYKQEKTI